VSYLEPVNLLGRSVLMLAAVIALAACSSGGSKHATPSATTTAADHASTTAATSSAACASTTTVAATKGGGDAAPPGDIPDNQAFVPYSPPDSLYTVKVPEGWARKDAPNEVHFTDKLNALDILVADAPTPPTVESAKADEVPKLAAATTCFELKNVTTITRKAGPAVLITSRADSAPDPVTGRVVRDDIERYEFQKNGKQATLTLSAPVGSDNVDPWKIVTDSFTWR
jgi:hypothetical protein